MKHCIAFFLWSSSQLGKTTTLEIKQMFHSLPCTHKCTSFWLHTTCCSFYSDYPSLQSLTAVIYDQWSGPRGRGRARLSARWRGTQWGSAAAQSPSPGSARWAGINQRPVLWSPDQSEAFILVMWPTVTNQRPVYCGNLTSIDQSEACIVIIIARCSLTPGQGTEGQSG